MFSAIITWLGIAAGLCLLWMTLGYYVIRFFSPEIADRYSARVSARYERMYQKSEQRKEQKSLSRMPRHNLTVEEAAIERDNKIRTNLKDAHDFRDKNGLPSTIRRFVDDVDSQTDLMWALRNPADEVARRHLEDVLMGAQFSRDLAEPVVLMASVALGRMAENTPESIHIATLLSEHEAKLKSAESLVGLVEKALDRSGA